LCGIGVYSDCSEVPILQDKEFGNVLAGLACRKSQRKQLNMEHGINDNLREVKYLFHFRVS